MSTSKKALGGSAATEKTGRVLKSQLKETTAPAPDNVVGIASGNLPAFVGQFAKHLSEHSIEICKDYLNADKLVEVSSVPLAFEYLTTNKKALEDFGKIGSTKNDATCVGHIPALAEHMETTDNPDVYELPVKAPKATKRKASVTKSTTKPAVIPTRNRVLDMVEYKHPLGIALVADIRALKEKTKADNNNTKEVALKLDGELKQKEKDLRNLFALNQEAIMFAQKAIKLCASEKIGFKIYSRVSPPEANAFQLPAFDLTLADNKDGRDNLLPWIKGQWIDTDTSKLIMLFDIKTTRTKKGVDNEVTGQLSVSVADFLKMDIDAIKPNEDGEIVVNVETFKNTALAPAKVPAAGDAADKSEIDLETYFLYRRRMTDFLFEGALETVDTMFLTTDECAAKKLKPGNCNKVMDFLITPGDDFDLKRRDEFLGYMFDRGVFEKVKIRSMADSTLKGERDRRDREIAERQEALKNKTGTKG